MRPVFLLIALSGLALAAPARADHPRALGHFGDWIAATHDESGQIVCYAFTRALVSTSDADVATTPTAPLVVMSVTQRSTERDDVAITTGVNLTRDQAFVLDVAGRSFDFYTAQHAAFARDGSAVVMALTGADMALDHGRGPHDTPVADQFSLHGFSAAYDTINRACPEH